MPNRLANENSPYLLQHKDNPVDWYPWGEEALEKARQENKPIFLSIGYAACHWCHVMAHESFEDAGTAALMNELFINIKVDREERPDLDSIYMNAVVAITGQGGWPMSLFLTPDGYPFYGGTYFPPNARLGMPAFKNVLIAIDEAWKNDRGRLLESSQELVLHLKRSSSKGAVTGNLNSKSLDVASKRLEQSYDWENGGWGKAPKFPQPMTIEFLLHRASRGDQAAAKISEHVLDAMALGGLYDVVGGGFARYSTDDHWLVPHFEKMLYDNAQLARAYLHAYLVLGKEAYRLVCTQTLDFILRELSTIGMDTRVPEVGFYSSLDADSEGEEGKYYLWTPAEIRRSFATSGLNFQQDYDFFGKAYGIRPEGNFEGKTVLQRANSDRSLAEMFRLSEEDVVSRLAQYHKLLLATREKRVRPGLDDKVLTSWNGLALTAFAEAARYLKRPDYLEIARANADFLLKELYLDGRLLRSWRNGKAQHLAYLEDHASLALGLLALYQSDPDARWYTAAEMLAMDMLENFRDPQGGFYDTRINQPGLIIRAKDVQDNATPSGNALAALALLQLATYSGNDEWLKTAEEVLSSILPTAERYPTAFAQWLIAADFYLAPIQEVAILGGLELPETRTLINTIWGTFRPDLLAAISAFPPAPGAPALLEGRSMQAGLPTAYVCRGFVCQSPVTTAEELAQQLNYSKTSITGQ